MWVFDGRFGWRWVQPSNTLIPLMSPRAFALFKSGRTTTAVPPALPRNICLMNNGAPILPIKIVCVGDNAVGKTSMIIRLVYNQFPEYFPTVYDSLTHEMILDGANMSVELCDTGGGEEYHDRLRSLSYLSTDVLALSFAVNLPKSFKNIERTWIPELTHHCPDVPIVLIGTKSDLRDDVEQECTPKLECLELARRIGAAEYHECSSFTGEGVQHVFERIADVGLQHRIAISKSKDSNCLLS